MESFAEIKKLFDFSIPDMINDIMLELNDEIIQLNQEEQLSDGIDALGQKIITITAEEQNVGNVYAEYTIVERAANDLQTNNVDLNFTGAFWKTFKVVQITGGWQVLASFGLYGGTIEDNFDAKFDFLGLTELNTIRLVRREVLPRLEKRIKVKMGL